MKYHVFSEDQINQALTYDGPVLIERHCVECGDALLGLPNLQATLTCEDGYHYTRSGVSYVGSNINVDVDAE